MKSLTQALWIWFVLAALCSAAFGRSDEAAFSFVFGAFAFILLIAAVIRTCHKI